MRYICITLRSVFVFYFLASIFASILVVKDNTFANYLLPAVLFGILVSLTPSFITFLKISENPGSELLVAIITMFSFFLLGSYVLGLFSLQPGSFSFGNGVSISIADKLIALVVVSVLAASLNVILDVINKRI